MSDDYDYIYEDDNESWEQRRDRLIHEEMEQERAARAAVAMAGRKAAERTEWILAHRESCVCGYSLEGLKIGTVCPECGIEEVYEDSQQPRRVYAGGDPRLRGWRYRLAEFAWLSQPLVVTVVICAVLYAITWLVTLLI